MDRWDLLFVAATLVTTFLPIIIVFVGSGQQWRAAQDRAREPRIGGSDERKAPETRYLRRSAPSLQPSSFELRGLSLASSGRLG
jgi:hypothetical protein